MSNKQKGAAGAKKSGESEAEIADAFMEEIAKREVKISPLNNAFVI